MGMICGGKTYLSMAQGVGWMDRVHKGVGNDVYRKEKDGLNIWDSRAYSSARCFSLVLA